MNHEGRHALTAVAGLQFYDLPVLRDALQQGVRLRWQRDPDNEADSNAISLWLDRDEAEAWDLLPLIKAAGHRQRWMLGHLPADDAAELAPLLDGGQSMDVYVHGGHRAGPWSVNVRLEGGAIDALRQKAVAVEIDRQKEQLAYAALDACGKLDRLFPGQGWGEVHEQHLGLKRPCWVMTPSDKRPYGMPDWRDREQIRDTPERQARHKELEKVFGAARAKRQISLRADIDKQEDKIARLASRLRASARRGDVDSEAVVAAEALEAALAALGRMRAID